MLRTVFVAILLAVSSQAWKLPAPLAKSAATAGLISAVASSTLAPPAALATPPSFDTLPSVTLAEKVTRQGIYRDYDVDIVQVREQCAGGN